VKKTVKVIPCLDMKEGRVVKGIKFVNLRDARDPVEAPAPTRNKAPTRSLSWNRCYRREEGHEAGMGQKRQEGHHGAICVGGGIRNTADMQELFDIGVNKVSINTAAYRNPTWCQRPSGNRRGQDRGGIDGKEESAQEQTPPSGVGGERRHGRDRR